MDIDLMGPDFDALDQGGQEGSLAFSGQLGPALADFLGARDQPALRRRIGKPCRLEDAAGVEKPLAHSAGHEMLDLRGWNAQGGGAFALILSDQRARDIVAVARALFDRIARRHPVALGVEQHPSEQAKLVSACAGVALGGIASEPHLNRLPQRLVNDWRVLARMGLSLVTDLAAVGAVPQHQVERPAREWLATDHPTRGTRPRLALASLGFELFLQQPHRAEFGIAAKDRAHEFRLAVDDDQLAVAPPIPERRHPAHPHPLLFSGGDLVADALADDLALELRKGQQNIE